MDRVSSVMWHEHDPIVIKRIWMDALPDMRYPKADDFCVCIGKLKSNTVYHIVSTRSVPREGRVRHHLSVIVSDLPTALMREDDQHLFQLSWYPRKRKST